MPVPRKPQTTGNEQHVTPLTPNMKTGGMWFTCPQLAGDARVTFLNPSLDLSIAVERQGPFPWQNDCKTNKLDGTNKVAEWKLLLLVQHIEGGILSQKWGGRQTFWMLSRQRREIQSIAHSQPTRSGKEWVDYASQNVNDDHSITSFCSFTTASSLCAKNSAIRLERNTVVGSVESLKIYKPNHSTACTSHTSAFFFL